jgi:cobalt-zinc-cadmium efflux system membrane fusion protein
MKTVSSASVITLIGITMILHIACSSSSSKEETAEVSTTNEQTIQLNEAQAASANIVTDSIQSRMISNRLKVNGKIDVPPQNMISVSMPLGGYLKSTHLLPGMHVRKGEVIAVMEDPQYIELQQEYLTTKAQLEMAEQEFLRQQTLNKEKASSDKQLQQAKAAWASLRIAHQALSEKLKLIHISPSAVNERSISRSVNIYAPTSGFVSRVLVNIGKYVTPSDVLFELVNPSDIHLNMTVYEKDLPYLSIGQKVHAFTNAQPDKTYPCEIILISRNIESNGSTEVHCHFDDYNQALTPGMYMNAYIDVENASVPVLPEKAIQRYEGKQYVFVLKGKHTYEMLAIETGAQEGEWIEIKNDSALSGRQIVKEGAYTLLMGLKNKAEE